MRKTRAAKRMPRKKDEIAGQPSLDEIKKLLMTLLWKFGASSEELGAVLGVTDRRIQQILPTKKIARIKIPQ